MLSVLCGALHALLAVGTSAVHVCLAPAPTRGQTRGASSPPWARHACPAVAPGPRRVSGFSLPLDHRGGEPTLLQGARRALLGASSSAGGGSLAFVRLPLSSRPQCLARSLRPCLAPPAVVAVRFLRSLLSVCEHSCVVSTGQAPGGEKWNRLSRRNAEPLLSEGASRALQRVTHGAALPRVWGPSTDPGEPQEPGSVAPSPVRPGQRGRQAWWPPLGGARADSPSESLVGRWSVSG